MDLQYEINELWEELNSSIQAVLRSGHFIMGPNVQAFEEEAAKFLGVKHAIGCNSGTDALVIALTAAGVGPGDEVITTSFTFFATAEAISQVRAHPVFVDIDPLTLNIDPLQIEKVITSRTKAIIPVHLFGQAVDMQPITELCIKYGLKIIEDVAQAFGGSYKGKMLGSIGDVGCFSFFPTKNLGAYGDGGLLTTNDDGIADVSRMLRAHGSRKKYYNELIGYNSRLDELQAAILRVKLPHLKRWNELRKSVASVYNELLHEASGITTPYHAPYADHVYHQYTIRIAEGKRDHVAHVLQDHGISTMIYYPTPVHQLPVYAHLGYKLPHTREAANEVLSLPIWPQMEREIQEKIVESLRHAMN
ncbi:DegT/DnrJ/EryC1/StrS family aminotransferase [Paenibacillus sp. N1-5-1-14]|uniref:DegT/DnrJ/EryC1/StrS family aminotransferase n=1 Tax=Paenibacillus radicibacter TaxID=2972488 RepID=UPI00215941B2|nr:DegT/DnrJ/EryC1/StrS family aminotransferase [Paenibacillus radicibacter]MCR8641087.1 DegT/DnrJ/EryC1/StrS family aminotransferase [Paenibacillus radicibacter]